MKRITTRNRVFQKNRLRAKKRVVHSANMPVGQGSLYQDLKARGGDARICIIRSVGGIGDVLMSTPVLRQIKREFPKTHLTYAIDRHRTDNDAYYHLLKNAWFIDEFVDARYVERERYDHLVDISAVCIKYERRGLPAINRIDLFARACGITRLKDKLPFLELTEEELARTKRQLHAYRASGKKLVFLHTASFEDKRSWRVKNQVKLIKMLEDNNPEIVILVSDFNHVLGDLQRFKNVHDVSHTSVREMAATIAYSDLFVGPDSGPMHIAGALQKPSLVLFGSVPPSARINYYRYHTAVVSTGLSCLGCWYEGCPIKIKCMSDISADMVYNKIMEKLNA